MHILLVRLLQGVAIAVILALGRLAKFVGRCLLARRRFLASPLPGPPLSNALLGEVGQPADVFRLLFPWLLMCTTCAGCQPVSDCTLSAAAPSHTNHAAQQSYQAMCRPSWAPRERGPFQRGPASLAQSSKFNSSTSVPPC